jgi:hypothetical protein
MFKEKICMVRNGGIMAILLTIYMVDFFAEPVEKMSAQTAVLSGEWRIWLCWGAVIWICFALLLSLLLSKNSPLKRPIKIQMVLYPSWFLAWQAISIGFVLALLTGDIRWGIGIAWISVPWITILVLSDLKKG